MTELGQVIQRFETFSYLPPLTDEEVAAQIGSILDRGLIPAIEHTTDPGPRNVYRSMWKLPLSDVRTVEDVLAEVDACAQANPDAYITLNGYDGEVAGPGSKFRGQPPPFAGPRHAQLSSCRGGRI